MSIDESLAALKSDISALLVLNDNLEHRVAELKQALLIEENDLDILGGLNTAVITQ